MGFNMSGFVRKFTELKINGLNLKFSEITLGDLGEFKAHLVLLKDKDVKKRKKQILENAKDIDGNIEPMALLEKLDKPLTDDEMEAEIDTIEGACFLAWLSLRFCQPQINLDHVKSIIGIGDMEDVSLAMFPEKEEAKKKRLAMEKKARKSPGVQQSP